MKLSAQTDYAIRMLIYCNAVDGLTTVDEIATRCRMPKQLTAKLVSELVSLNLLTSVRGRRGGVCLASEGGSMLLGDIVRAVEGKFMLAECFDLEAEQKCPLIEVCTLNFALWRALDSFFAVLNQYSLDDLSRSRADATQTGAAAAERSDVLDYFALPRH